MPRVSSLREERRRQNPSSTRLWNGANWRIRPWLEEEEDEVEGGGDGDGVSAIVVPPEAPPL